MAKLLPKLLKPTNSVETFQKAVAFLCPKAVIRVEAGGEKAGNVWIDIEEGGHQVTGEWRVGRGIGLYTGDGPYGGLPQEVFPDVAMAARRVRQLLAGSEPGPLQMIRDLLDLSQAEVAEKLSVKQAAVSRIEKREDPKLQSLIKNVHAMGGELEVRVRLAGGEFTILRSVPTKASDTRVSKKQKEVVHA
jgi:DNA-binding XRE family transcriptional regulator